MTRWKISFIIATNGCPGGIRGKGREEGVVGDDRGGLKESVAEEEHHCISHYLVPFSEAPISHRATTYILYILRGVVD